jgi:hypothetical protein
MFVTSHGNPYPRFQRALKTGNLTLIRAAAAELPRIGLRDALEICLVMRDKKDHRFERAAVRWIARFALEARDVTLEAIQTAVAALNAMPDQPERAMATLGNLCAQYGVAV